MLGHVFRLDFAEAYRDWSCDALELFEAPVVRETTSGSVCRSLREAVSGAEALVLFLDCDREGEAICFEVMEVCGRQQRVLRAKFSSVTTADVVRAMAALGKPDERLSDAVLARQELDLRLGVAMTR